MTQAQINVHRAIYFLACDKKNRIKMCMKQDIIKHLDEFDTSDLPEKDPEILATKLMYAFIHVEGNDELSLY